jgi:plasmid stabilization system protein ParE
MTPTDRRKYAERAAMQLRTARAWLRLAGAERAAAYVARALKSVEGAQRHARGLESRARDRRTLPLLPGGNERSSGGVP